MSDTMAATDPAPAAAEPEAAPAEAPAPAVVPDAPVVSWFVHSVEPEEVLKRVVYRTQETWAKVPAIIVELTDVDGQHGTQTLRYFTDDEKAYAVATYRAGETIDRAI